MTRHHSGFKRWLVHALVMLAALICVVATGAPVARADSVSPHSTSRWTPGYGAVSIATESGGYLRVRVVKRWAAVNHTMPAGPRCVVYVRGHGVSTSRVLHLNREGSGSVRIGKLPHGTYQVSGRCGDRYDGEKSLTMPQTVRVRIDGTGTVRAPKSTVPDIRTGPIVRSCSDGVQAAMATDEAKALAEDVIRETIGVLAKQMTDVGMPAEDTLQQVCGVLDYVFQPGNVLDDPAEAFQNFCRVGRSLIPASAVYRLFERLGDVPGLRAFGDFNGRLARSWDAQCE